MALICVSLMICVVENLHIPVGHVYVLGKKMSLLVICLNGGSVYHLSSCLV